MKTLYRTSSRIAPVLVVVFLLMLTAANARADDVNGIKVTFSRPVEIPGMVLAAGRYVFKWGGDTSDKDRIVEVFNENQTRLLAMLSTVPDYRNEPANKTSVSLEEQGNGAPERVESLSVQGETRGYEFIYGKSKSAASEPRNH